MVEYSATAPEQKKETRGRKPSVKMEQFEALAEKVASLQEDVNTLLEAIHEKQSAPVEMPDLKVVAALKAEVENLKACIGKMAHYSGGNIPTICREFGIDVYEATHSDMHRRRG